MAERLLSAAVALLAASATALLSSSEPILPPPPSVLVRRQPIQPTTPSSAPPPPAPSAGLIPNRADVKHRPLRRHEVDYWRMEPEEALRRVRKELDDAPAVSDDPGNASIFKRSYELMERMLKVFIYEDGRRPIFCTKGPSTTTLLEELCKNTIKALCNADASEGIFVRGKDVSLPETAIKVPKRPLKNVGGGRPISQRSILAFYAGNMHGRVRPILNKHWGNDKDEVMKIYRRLPNRVSRTMSYVEHMRTSKFCICLMGVLKSTAQGLYWPFMLSVFL